MAQIHRFVHCFDAHLGVSHATPLEWCFVSRSGHLGRIVKEILNQLFMAQKIPGKFKEAKLVLIVLMHKTGKPSVACRNFTGPSAKFTLWQNKWKLCSQTDCTVRTEYRRHYGVNQYEDGTLDALSKMKEIAQKTKFRGAGDRWYILLTVDVKNA